MERRELLSVAGVSLTAALAGCFGDDDDDTRPDDSDDSGTEGERDGEEKSESVFEDGFRAESQSGFIAFDVETADKEQAMDAGFVFPDDDPIVFEADIEDGRWEATDVEFPDLETDDGVTATVELAEGFSGELTGGHMTAEGTVAVTVDLLGESFSFDIAATSGDSNALQGSTDFESDPKTATVVDNEFVVEEGSGNALVDEEVGLPAPEPGTNWFELTLAFDQRDAETAQSG